MKSSGISIVIPAYNEEVYLPAALTSLFEARKRFENETGLSSEVIVVDNASTDLTAQVAAVHGAIVILHTVRSISSVRNAGIRKAQFDVVVTIDADCRMPEDGLVKIAQAMEDGRLIGAALGVKMDTDSLYKKILVFTIITVVGWVAGISGGMFCFRREDALAIGGFREDLLIAEDRAFAADLRRYGKKQGRKFIMLKSVKIETADRKDIGVLAILPLFGLIARAVSGAKLTTDELGFWYKPKR